MRLIGTALALLLVLHGSALADPLIDELLGGTNPELTEEEESLFATLGRNRPGGGQPTVDPVLGRDGSVRFVYGVRDPHLVCAPMQICDLELQPGEELLHVNIGDPGRWTVEPTYSGAKPNETPHVFVTPLDVGLSTRLVVTTNRRTYHFNLKSHLTKNVPKVNFTYPEDASAKVALLRAARAREHRTRGEESVRERIPETGESLSALAFDYRIEGRAPWKPLRVYNNGVKTIIEMPPAMAHTEAPTLLVLRTEGGLFTDDELVMVNYRIEPPPRSGGAARYIVDSVFDRAVLLAGVGGDQLRITITRLAGPE